MNKRKSSNQEKAKCYAKILLIALAAVVVVSIVLMLVGCSPEESNYEIVDSTSTVQAEGRYHLFKTKDEQEYLNFLEDFDESQYEIVDISTSMYTGMYSDGEFYMVTYRNITSDSN